MNRLGFQYVLLLFVAADTGCAGRIPIYPWVDQAQAARLFAERSGKMHTLSARCRVILADSHTGPTQLDAAIAARTPGSLRLRAWKFSQPVLDITLTPEGLWLCAAEDAESEGDRASPFASLTAEQLRQAWSLVTGEFPPEQWTWEENTSLAAISISRKWEPDGSIECTIDRSTLTVRQCVLARSADAEPMTLTLDRYRAIEQVAVPTHVSMRSEHGTIAILLDDISLNEELPQFAFEPPRRAIKQP